MPKPECNFYNGGEVPKAGDIVKVLPKWKSHFMKLDSNNIGTVKSVTRQGSFFYQKLLTLEENTSQRAKWRPSRFKLIRRVNSSLYFSILSNI